MELVFSARLVWFGTAAAAGDTFLPGGALDGRTEGEPYNTADYQMREGRKEGRRSFEFQRVMTAAEDRFMTPAKG